MLRFAVLLLVWCLSSLVTADTVYQKPEDFVHETFGATSPAPQFIWLDAKLQQSLTQVLGHAYPQLRIRYWRNNGRTVWILDEIGKEFPITAGFVVAGNVADNKVAVARVLIYRETRGDEIHIPAFLKQFVGLHITNDKLDGRVDGITGATLSVNAMKKMAHAALLLDRAAP
jgi:Na+-translocating ferredoxin:NAD+ oxidoreductase RnfG subunit